MTAQPKRGSPLRRRAWLVGALTGVLASARQHAKAADDNPLQAERWKSRPLVLVVPSTASPVLAALEAALRTPAVRAQFEERDMVLYTVVAGQGRRDTVPLAAAQTRALLEALSVKPGDPARAWLVGLDGGFKLSVLADQLSLDAVFQEIDQMPMRRR